MNAIEAHDCRCTTQRRTESAMRPAILLASSILVMAVGCGGTKTKAPADLATADDLGVDMAEGLDGGPLAANACGAILTCTLQGGLPSVCLAGKPQSAQDLFNTVASCSQTACGQKVGDAAPTSTCSPAPVDGGANGDTCAACLNNTLFGPDGPFVDGSGDSLMCAPVSAPVCGVCASEATSCTVQCFNQADCDNLPKASKCQNGTCVPL
jgi:hypothetical protein